MKAYKKKTGAILACILLCGLSACGIPNLPEPKDFVEKAGEEYYTPNGYEIEHVQIDQETVDKKGKTADRVCIITAKSNDGSFQAVDSWLAHYTYSESWELNEKTLLSSEYQLLEDLSESRCRELLGDNVPEGVRFTSITTNRNHFSAEASCSYTGRDEIAGGFGNLDMALSGEAEFAWDETNRWTLVDYQDDWNLVYTAAFTLSSKPETLNSERFSLELDVSVNDNIPTLEVTHYQGSIDTIGSLSVSNPQLVKDEEQSDILIIAFDFNRSIDDIKNDQNYSDYYDQLGAYYPAEGNGYIEVSKDGHASLALKDGSIMGGQVNGRITYFMRFAVR